MSTYYDSQNRIHKLGERIGSGGEGTVYFSGEDETLVGKIYHEPISLEKAEKLGWMAANRDERLLKVAAWVVDVLKDAPDGKIVGFLMPSVKAKEIHELYSLKSRRVYFPEATWHFLVHTAANVARAFYNLHRAGHVMGDVNHGNCVVLADGTVKLIDCDSFSVRTETMRYSCEVGVATHLAPELQGANLSEVERETKHDNFGLAVIIFQLLFLGRHPFAGMYLGAEDKSIEECIRELRFAYGTGAADRKVKQPPGTLPLNAVGSRVALMFERAFLTEDRPEPREWIEALEDLERNLEQCALHPGHLYFKELSLCPFCDLESQTGLMLFPFVTNGNNAGEEKPFNIFTVETLIANLGIGNNLPAKPLTPAVLPPPTAEVAAAKKASQFHLTFSLTAQFVGMIFLMVVFGVGVATFIGICALVFWLVFTNNSAKYLREELEENLSTARTQWELFENEWQKHSMPPKLDKDVAEIKKKIGDYQKFQQTSAKQLKAFDETEHRRQLVEHLGTARLVDAGIDGIRPKQMQILLDRGFETAAEMDRGRLRYIPEIGDRTITKLTDWRKKLEFNFVAKTSEEDLKKKRAQLAVETASERRRIEREIEFLFGSLRSGALALRRRQQELSAQSTELAKRLAQATSDAAHLGTNSALVIGLILITFVTPYVGFIVKQVNEPRNSVRNGSYATSAPTAEPRSSSSRNLDVPNPNITDAEIAALNMNRRETYANNLYSLVTDNFNSSNPNYADAERKMRLANRLIPSETLYLNELGRSLYEQGKYDDAIYELSRSLEIDPQNSRTKWHIGIAYLWQENFKEARKVFAETVKNDPNSFDGNYNLGVAYIGLKDYKAAALVLQKATEVRVKDVEAHYQLGICYVKLGKMNAALAEYNTLFDLDSDRAADFVAETKIKPPPTTTESIQRVDPPDRIQGDWDTAPPPPAVKEKWKSN